MHQAFIVYLLSHDRPMAEVLASRQKDIRQEFGRGFVGMARESVNIEALVEARAALVADILGTMPTNHRSSLLSFERGTPDWSLLGIEHAPKLPAVRWRQQNLDTLTPAARAALVSRLEAALSK
jgi:hypothetical protein